MSEHPGGRIKKCRSCGAEIVWTITDAGRRMPVDAEPVNDLADLPGLFVLRAEAEGVVRATSAAKLDYYLSHFATCPNADQHRKTTSEDES